MGIVYRFVIGNYLAFRIDDVGIDCYLFTLLCSVYFHAKVYRSIIACNLGCCNVCTPHGYMHPCGIDDMHIAVKTCTWIPARCSLFILQLYYEFVCTGLNNSFGVNGKRVVAIRPETNLFTIKAHMGIAHCTVKQYRDFATGGICNFEICLVNTLPDKRKATCASGFHSFLFLAILFHGYFLKVVCSIKRTINSPVMRHTHILPFLCIGKCAVRELPAFIECALASLRVSTYSKTGKRNQYDFFH